MVVQVKTDKAVPPTALSPHVLSNTLQFQVTDGARFLCCSPYPGVWGGRCLSAFLIAANMQQKPRMIKLVQLFLHNVFKWRKLNTLVEPRPFCLREVWWTQHKKHPRHQVWTGFVSVTIDLFLYIVSLALRCIVEGWHTCTLDCNWEVRNIGFYSSLKPVVWASLKTCVQIQITLSSTF